MIPHENHRENAIRIRRDPISGVEFRNVDPLVELVVGEHVPRAPGVTDLGVDGVRPANRPIRRITMARVPTPMRLEVATGAMMADIVTEGIGIVEDMDMVEDIIGMSNLLASRCPAAHRSEMMGRAVAASLT